MTSAFKTLVILGAFLATGYGLTCRQCVIGLLNTCFFPSDTTCNNATQSCYYGDAQFNSTGAFKLHTRGCLDNDLCEKTLTGSLLGAGYTASFRCCTTDLCNSASSLHLSVVMGTVLTLLCTVWVSQ
ncbi:hypothetical protein WMY93_015609 [Mugilogobius chulae]|uniref:UPAR/Ly6 domain-containing protein n=1 Tax=Mugilogobius chulae TaxID=88201 RepID=A0AAW0NT72_9GOBI